MKYILHNRQSERLYYRTLEETDFDWWMGFCSHPESTRYFDFSGKISPEEFCRVWFKRVFERYENNSGGHNVLVEKTTKLPVGMCGLLLQEVDGKKELEIGYSLHPDYRGKGFATEAAQTCRDFAFDNNFANSLISIIHVENFASAKVALRTGMIFEKETFHKGIKVNVFRLNK